MKKILLHGATNCGSSNYGDFIYAYEVYQYLSIKYDVELYQPSPYFKKYLGLSEHKHIGIHDADYLVYLPGGYFGEGHNARFRDNLVQFLRFMPFGLIGILFRKHIIVIGVGAGPVNSWFMRSAVRMIGRHATVITTRDKSSYQAMDKLGIRNIHDYFDMILAFPLARQDKLSKQLEQVLTSGDENRILLVHYNHSHEAMVKFAAAVNEFIAQSSHRYTVVVSSDSILDNEEKMYQEFKHLCHFNSVHYIYDNPFDFTELLRRADVVLTCKLHVGVVAAMFDKSVICAAEHPEKTIRFYSYIGEFGRCSSLYKSDPENILINLKKYENQPMHIDSRVKNLAMKHWDALNLAIRK